MAGPPGPPPVPAVQLLRSARARTNFRANRHFSRIAEHNAADFKQPGCYDLAPRPPPRAAGPGPRSGDLPNRAGVAVGPDGRPTRPARPAPRPAHQARRRAPVPAVHGLPSLECSSCSSGRDVASGFLPTPPHGDAVVSDSQLAPPPPAEDLHLQAAAHARCRAKNRKGLRHAGGPSVLRLRAGAQARRRAKQSLQ